MKFHGITMVGSFINQLVSSNPTWVSDDEGRLCYDYVLGQLKLAGTSAYITLIDNTNTQTIGGTKTFSSIPYLPSSDPTHDDHAVRKGYLDDTYGSSFYKVKVSSDDTTASYLYNKLREGDGIEISVYNGGGDEDVEISIEDIDSFVRTTDPQSIDGIKTFSAFPVLPPSAPSSDYQAAHKKYVDDQIGGSQSFVSGTKMLFFQDSAPTGWTQITTYNDRVLRVVNDSSGGSIGGSWTISGLEVEGTALTVSQMAHEHTISRSGNFHYTTAQSGGQVGIYNILSTISTNSVSSSEATEHTHDISVDGEWRPSYVNVILCSKD